MESAPTTQTIDDSSPLTSATQQVAAAEGLREQQYQADVLRMLVNAQGTDMYLAKELAVRVMSNFIPGRNRTNWEAVSKDMNIPLIECLWAACRHFSGSSFRSMPNLADWHAEDRRALVAFVENNVHKDSDWQLAAVYMSIKREDCIGVYRQLCANRALPKGYAAIDEPRRSGMGWQGNHRPPQPYTSGPAPTRELHYRNACHTGNATERMGGQGRCAAIGDGRVAGIYVQDDRGTPMSNRHAVAGGLYLLAAVSVNAPTGKYKSKAIISDSDIDSD